MGGSTKEKRSAASWQVFIGESAHRFGLPAPWIRALMQVESTGNPRAVSRKGAIGLMQIMPATYAELRVRYGLGADPYDPHDNILAGAAYLREMYDRYGTSGFLAAYNAGPGRYETQLATGRPLPDETRAYVGTLGPSVTGEPKQGRMSAALPTVSWTRASLFFARTGGMLSEDSQTRVLQTEGRRTTRSAVDLSGLIARSNGLFFAHFVGMPR